MMAKQDQDGPSAPDVQDPAAFADARAAFGYEGALERLRMFRRDLDRHLSSIGEATPDHETLREMAHRTAGRAGFLGFPALADASLALDEATRLNRGVAAALDLWTEQARLAAEGPPAEADTCAPDLKDMPSAG